LKIVLLSVLWFTAAYGQLFLTGMGGSAALSNAAGVSANPVSASNYDAKVGPALSISPGFHFNDWFSVQAFYIWNRNRIIANAFTGSQLVSNTTVQTQHALGADLLLYFRPRSSHIRPYLSVGPAWVHLWRENRPGYRVAVGTDLLSRRTGWGVRYTFSEMMSPNPFAAALSPPAKSRLMNFQNLVGIIKTF
jgi:hypothetical protein